MPSLCCCNAIYWENWIVIYTKKRLIFSAVIQWETCFAAFKCKKELFTCKNSAASENERVRNDPMDLQLSNEKPSGQIHERQRTLKNAEEFLIQTILFVIISNGFNCCLRRWKKFHLCWLFVEIGWNVMRFFFFIFRLTKRTLMSASRTKQWFDCGQTATNVIGIFWNGSITSFVCFGWTVYFVLPKMHCLPSLFQPVVLTFFAHRRCSNAFLWLEWRRQTNWYIGKLGE